MTYERRCETNRFAWRNGPSAFAGFPFRLWPETKRRSRLRLVAALRTSKRLKAMPQKLRKGALKLLKDPRNYRILIGPQSRPIRALKGPSALVFNGLTG
jgi:hypothetical protein